MPTLPRRDTIILQDMDKDVEEIKVHRSASPDDAPVTLLTGMRLTLVFGYRILDYFVCLTLTNGFIDSAFLIAFALIALDQTILATALPKIASHFDAVSKLSWIASAYFLPQAAFMLFFGSVLSIAPTKPIFLLSITIFELGSLLCAVAPSVDILILGRAVAGFGASGLWVSIMSTIARIMLHGGGVFWGGNIKPWSNPGIIICLVLFGLLLVTFVAWEYKKGSKGILPLKMLLRRSILGAFIESAFIQLAFVIAVVSVMSVCNDLDSNMSATLLLSTTCFQPLLYQVRGHSATKSGIDILPFMISGVITTLAAGVGMKAKGLAWPFLLFGPLIASVGFGLLFTTNLDSTTARLLGYQILVGVGLGAAVQNTLVVAQAEYVNEEALVPLVTSLITFTQCLGGSIGLA
ncbi:hypothetical protein C0991_008143, partial [Blastosporella zonata]